MKLSSVLVLLLIFLTISCRKDEKPPYCEQFPDECVDITGVKDYFAFNVGSYWVYEEEFSGAIDCVYVTSFVNDPSSYYFRTETYSTHNEFYYNYWSFGGIVDSGLIDKKGKGVKVKLSKVKPGQFVSEASCFIFYPEPGKFSFNSVNVNMIGVENFIRVTEMKSEQLNGNNYNHCVTITEDYNASEHWQATSKTYCAEVGLVEKTLLDSNMVWRLVDYHISP